jgi:hypothetical protein
VAPLSVARNGTARIVLAQHEVEDAAVFRKAVLQRHAFGEHLDPLDGFAGEVVELGLAREVTVDEYHGGLVAACYCASEGANRRPGR